MANLFNPPKRVKLNLTKIDGNAFSLMGAFRSRAKREGWAEDDIKTVTSACMSGDYDNLLCVLLDHTK